MNKRSKNPPSLSGKERNYWRKNAHSLNPLVHIGQNGPTEAVASAIKEALDHHELIKIKFQEFKEDKRVISDQIADDLGAHVIGIIGNIAILYRESEENN
jgi:RNA-binding protein